MTAFILVISLISVIPVLVFESQVCHCIDQPETHIIIWVFDLYFIYP